MTPGCQADQYKSKQDEAPAEGQDGWKVVQDGYMTKGKADDWEDPSSSEDDGRAPGGAATSPLVLHNFSRIARRLTRGVRCSA